MQLSLGSLTLLLMGRGYSDDDDDDGSFFILLLYIPMLGFHLFALRALSGFQLRGLSKKLGTDEKPCFNHPSFSYRSWDVPHPYQDNNTLSVFDGSKAVR